jgi:hypothetical protein
MHHISDMIGQFQIYQFNSFHNTPSFFLVHELSVSAMSCPPWTMGLGFILDRIYRIYMFCFYIFSFRMKLKIPNRLRRRSTYS